MEDRTRHQDHHAGPAHEADRGSHTAMYRGSAVAATTDHHDHATQNDHVVQGSGQHAGHGTARFKNRFWLALALSVPVVYFSPMFGHLLGSMPPVFPGSTWIPPVLGTVIFLYGGQPFLKGGLNELRSRQPGMMLLIGMAISVAFVASWATSLGIGGLDLDFWGTGPAGRDHAAGPLD
ncbi:MAG: copper-translocating P-type ATPase [Arthrobacter sp.]|nr:copper-translocating P-type ATPase [Arthrobacter sp.]